MDLSVGQTIESQSFSEISPERLQAYASASGDFNPIHLDAEVARNAGLPGTIAHGMLIAAFIAERAESFIHREAKLDGFKVVHFQTRFKAMTFIGDTPSVGGVVKECSPQSISLDLHAKNQKGETLTTGLIRYERTSE